MLGNIRETLSLGTIREQQGGGGCDERGGGGSGTEESLARPSDRVLDDNEVCLDKLFNLV